MPGGGLAPACALGFLFLRHPRAPLARLGQADGDRLLAALDLPAGAAAAQRAGLALLHGAAHFLGRALGVFSLLRLLRHVFPPGQEKAETMRGSFRLVRYTSGTP